MSIILSTSIVGQARIKDWICELTDSDFKKTLNMIIKFSLNKSGLVDWQENNSLDLIVFTENEINNFTILNRMRVECREKYKAEIIINIKSTDYCRLLNKTSELGEWIKLNNSLFAFYRILIENIFTETHIIRKEIDDHNEKKRLYLDGALRISEAIGLKGHTFEISYYNGVYFSLIKSGGIIQVSFVNQLRIQIRYILENIVEYHIIEKNSKYELINNLLLRGLFLEGFDSLPELLIEQIDEYNIYHSSRGYILKKDFKIIKQNKKKSELIKFIQGNK